MTDVLLNLFSCHIQKGEYTHSFKFSFHLKIIIYSGDAQQRKRNKLQSRCQDRINYGLYVIHTCEITKPHVYEHDSQNKNKNKNF